MYTGDRSPPVSGSLLTLIRPRRDEGPGSVRLRVVIVEVVPLQVLVVPGVPGPTPHSPSVPPSPESHRPDTPTQRGEGTGGSTLLLRGPFRLVRCLTCPKAPEPPRPPPGLSGVPTTGFGPPRQECENVAVGRVEAGVGRGRVVKGTRRRPVLPVRRPLPTVPTPVRHPVTCLSDPLALLPVHRFFRVFLPDGPVRLSAHPFRPVCLSHPSLSTLCVHPTDVMVSTLSPLPSGLQFTLLFDGPG